MKTAKPSADLTALLSGTLTEKEAREICEQGRDAVVWAILALQKRVDELSSGSASGRTTLSTPSSTIPPYEKPQNNRRSQKSGAKPGHKGYRRADPEPDEEVEKTLDRCPECGGEVTKCRSTHSTRSRIIEDISPEPKVKATKYDVPGYWRRHCQKVVEPKVPEALPGRRISANTIALTAHLHYGLGSTTSQILDILNHHFSFIVTPGALIDNWKCAVEILQPWYDEIQAACLQSGVLHADESGWRVNGNTHWLWCFGTQNETYYLIHPTRGEEALNGFFVGYFDGVLITDFYAAYNSVECFASQKCLVHLLRDLKTIELDKDTGDNWDKFKSQLKRLVQDAVRLKTNQRELAPDSFARKRALLFKRLDELLDITSENREVMRLVKRLNKYRDHILTFLNHVDVPFDNNLAERSIRPAVLMRKTEFGNRSDLRRQDASDSYGVIRTLKQRGINPTDVVREALSQYVLCGKIPTLTDVSNHSEY